MRSARDLGPPAISFCLQGQRKGLRMEKRETKTLQQLYEEWKDTCGPDPEVFRLSTHMRELISENGQTAEWCMDMFRTLSRYEEECKRSAFYAGFKGAMGLLMQIGTPKAAGGNEEGLRYGSGA